MLKYLVNYEWIWLQKIAFKLIMCNHFFQEDQIMKTKKCYELYYFLFKMETTLFL